MKIKSIVEMKFAAIALALALASLAACASSLPVRNFGDDYGRASRNSVKIEGYPPFSVLELREQRRLKVALNVLAQTFGGLVDPLILLGVSDGIPPASAHRAAAQAYLAEAGRTSCAIVDAAVSPGGREFEFRYQCPGGT
jgi:hypothetical protein